MRRIPRAYHNHRKDLVDEIYTEAAKTMTWAELAREAGIAYTTVERLGSYETKRPQELTIWKLARAVGMELRLEKVGGKTKRYRLKKAA